MNRMVVAGLLGLLLALAGCGGGGSAGSGSAQGGSGEEQQASCDVENPPLFEEGVLTVATDEPAYPPWFEGEKGNYSGYEGEVANEISSRLGGGLEVEWVVEPFNRSYAPGAKDYDFDVNQITITPERERAVDFSDGYFDNAQGVLVNEDSPVADAETLSDLKDARIGVQVGTTSLDFVNERIQPNEEPRVYDTTNDVKSALESGQIDALITDLVTTVYLRDVEFEGVEVIGQYPSDEQFGALFEQGNPLVGCVNEVLAEMREDGTLEDLQNEYLQDYLSVPTLRD